MKIAYDFRDASDAPPEGYRKREFSGTREITEDPHADECYCMRCEHVTVPTWETTWLCIEGCPATKGEER